jgi:hypothetical protein
MKPCFKRVTLKKNDEWNGFLSLFLIHGFSDTFDPEADTFLTLSPTAS